MLAATAGGIQTVLLHVYAGAAWLPATIDGLLSVGLLCGLAYLSWYILEFVSMFQTDLFVCALAMAFWLAGCFVVQYVAEQSAAVRYAPFAVTLPFRLLFGVLAWAVVTLWYRLRLSDAVPAERGGEPAPEEEALPAPPKQDEGMENAAPAVPVECIDRVTVKDGARIHLIETGELLYIQACGDYVTLFTPSGQYVKEQTMKYFEAHLPAATFVRVHRSAIVNVTQISRVELFGKENYRLLLKCGVKLKVSSSGYKLLKDRLGL